MAVISKKAAPYSKKFKMNGLKRTFLSDSHKYEELACDLVTNISRENPDLAIQAESLEKMSQRIEDDVHDLVRVFASHEPERKGMSFICH